MTAPEKRWVVACPRFVSAGFATKEEAQDHMFAILALQPVKE